MKVFQSNMLINENIYKRALLDPYVINNKKDLTVVTGYSSPSMVERHYNDTEGNISLKLLVGMEMSLRHRNAYLKLQERLQSFECFLKPKHHCLKRK